MKTEYFISDAVTDTLGMMAACVLMGILMSVYKVLIGLDHTYLNVWRDCFVSFVIYIFLCWTLRLFAFVAFKIFKR